MKRFVYLIVFAGLFLAIAGPASAEVSRFESQVPWNRTIAVNDSVSISIDGLEYEMINIKCSNTGECVVNQGSFSEEGTGMEVSTGTEYRYNYKNFKKIVLYPSGTFKINQKITWKLVSLGSSENYIMHCNVREIFDDNAISIWKCTTNQVAHNWKDTYR
jgi:hypothetical protein